MDSVFLGPPPLKVPDSRGMSCDAPGAVSFLDAIEALLGEENPCFDLWTKPLE